MNILRDKLAGYIHRTWSRWLKKLFDSSNMKLNSKGEIVGSIIVPYDLATYLNKKLGAAYESLSREDKEVNLDEAYEIIKLFNEHYSTLTELKDILLNIEECYERENERLYKIVNPNDFDTNQRDLLKLTIDKLKNILTD